MFGANRILLLGATGHTGRLVGEELLKNEIPFEFSGRDEKRLEILAREWKRPYFSLDLSKPSDFEKIGPDVTIIINCAGPFNLYALQFLEFLDGRKVTYLDISGEQSFVISAFNRLRGKNTKATFVHACAFESFVAEALAGLLQIEGKELLDISSFYYFKEHRVSPGTRLSMQIVRHFQTYVYDHKKLLPQAPADVIIDADATMADVLEAKAVFTPFPEVLFFSHRFNTQSASSYYVVGNEELFLFRRKPGEVRPLSEIVEKHKTREALKSNTDQSLAGHFKVSVRAKFKSGNDSIASLEGKNSYDVTATIVVEYLKELLQGAGPNSGVLHNTEPKRGFLPNAESKAGFYSPCELLDGRKVLDRVIAKHNLKLEIH